MDREKYRNITRYLEGKKLEEWSESMLKTLQKESTGYEVKHRILYKIMKNEKKLRVLKEDEIDSVIFMTHNHPTGGHFRKDATYNKINTRFW